MLDKLRFEVATRKHAEDIEKFLADQFGKTEPIGVSLNIAKGPYKQHKANQINAYVSTLEHRQKRLLGSNAKVFKLDILCVHREYMGRGLGKQLTERAIQTAQAEGCDWVATAATACASQGIFTKRGFQVFYEIPYSVFRENGNVVFQNLHDSCQGGKFMALRLSS
ncbi:acetyltransferase, GNAT family [Ancylostoma duodenale]|uniref:Acetyltransferase, GNAT family n=1 Tax=Ancylostoma duodenale TaxID=51022 RepID=A0A0C2G097_9BILA|nr:acetyltransferase, GNAT family [Ancylostoma duodenale]